MYSIFSSTELALLFRLVLAHVLTYFIFQSNKWVEDKRKNQGKSKYLYLHGCLTAIVAYILAGYWTNVWIPITIGITHTLIDYVKLKFDKEGSIIGFISDQFAHLVVIAIVWINLIETGNLFEKITPMASNLKVISIVTGYIICTTPLSFFVGIATKKWQEELKKGGTSIENLLNGGKWIGIIERLMIFTFVLLGKYEAIGFLITAKSILRFRQDTETKQSEYVLVGTLLSYGLAVMTGLMISQIIKV
jgi:Protein of unknown function (DUF3307)